MSAGPGDVVEDLADRGTGDGGPGLPRLGVRGTARWVWRQLTSMRVALMLLMLLAVVAVPGSVLPQRPTDPAAVADYLVANPGLGPWLDRLGLFDVYASVWFSAVYLLLFVSLIGCILPRVALHVRAARARPPRTPRRFDRFEVRDEAVLTGVGAAEAWEAAHHELTGGRRVLPRFRVEPAEEPDGALTLAAERGYLRETGNIVFHLALIGVLIGVAWGHLLHHRGQAIIVEGQGFANAMTDYDTFESGAWFDPASLVPWTLRLDAFTSEFDPDARPVDFTAAVTLTLPGDAPVADTIRVNHPLDTGDARVYLQGNGFAPDVTVHDAAGQVAFAGPVPFLPQDAVYTSRGVVKVPDVSVGEQIGIIGYLLPAALVDEDGARSLYPQPVNPLLVLTVWHGDLGLDAGVPQNVYELDVAAMTQVLEADGTPTTFFVEPGQTVDLPGDLGTLTWEGLPRFVALDLRHDPALGWLLFWATATIAGLTVSLFTPRRRVWLRVREADGRTVVAAAALARGDDAGLADELDRVMTAVRALQGPGEADA